MEVSLKVFILKILIEVKVIISVDIFLKLESSGDCKFFFFFYIIGLDYMKEVYWIVFWRKLVKKELVRMYC